MRAVPEIAVERPDYRTALCRSGILDKLAAFDPHIAGTPPLGIAIASSDIDVLCHAADPARVAAVIWAAFSGADDFSLRQWIGADRPVVGRFTAHGWPFEVFASRLPVKAQAGWRHFSVEARLLALGGAPFRAAVMARRRQGAKTEPAFAAVLGLPGDPYAALLALGDDAQLGACLTAAGFGSGRTLETPPRPA